MSSIMDTTTHLLLWKQKVLVANMAPHKLHVWVKLFTPNQEISLHQKFPLMDIQNKLPFMPHLPLVQQVTVPAFQS